MRAGKERSAALTLTAFEIAIRGRDRVLTGAELIPVHGDAHRAPWLAPLGAGLAEHGIEPFGLGLALDID